MALEEECEGTRNWAAASRAETSCLGSVAAADDFVSQHHKLPLPSTDFCHTHDLLLLNEREGGQRLRISALSLSPLEKEKTHNSLACLAMYGTCRASCCLLQAVFCFLFFFFFFTSSILKIVQLAMILEVPKMVWGPRTSKGFDGVWRRSLTQIKGVADERRESEERSLDLEPTLFVPVVNRRNEAKESVWVLSFLSS